MADEQQRTVAIDEEAELLSIIARDHTNRAAQIQAIRMLRQNRGAGDPAEESSGGDAAKPADNPFEALEAADELAPRRRTG